MKWINLILLNFMALFGSLGLAMCIAFYFKSPVGGLILVIILLCFVNWAWLHVYYDPMIELIPGRSFPRSLVNKLDYFEGVGSDGQWHKWPPERRVNDPAATPEK